MTRLSLVIPRVRTLRYVLIAVVAFSLGAATVAQAVPPGGILGIVQLADRTDSTRLAAVDAAGNVGVAVSNFPASQQVSGTVNVLDIAASQAASGRAQFTVTDLSPSNNAILYTVPSGKRLIVEYLSAHVETEATGNTPFVNCGPQLGAAFATVPMTFAGLSAGVGGERFVSSNPVRLYVPPGESIVCSASRSAGSSGRLVVFVSFYGYLVNAP